MKKMGQGGAGSKQGVSIVRQIRPKPIPTSSLTLEQRKTRVLPLQTVSPAYVLKNEILQHETCSLLNHDSNHIKNLI